MRGGETRAQGAKDERTKRRREREEHNMTDHKEQTERDM